MATSQNTKNASQRLNTAAARIVVLFSFGSLCALGCVPAISQMHHPDHETGVSIPTEILEGPVARRQGVGKIHEVVTTSSPQAQAFYDQGLAYLHSFVWIEAARSFNQALRLDPKLALAYVGLSDAYIGLADPASARAALDKAQSLADTVTEMERRKIEIHSL